MSRKLVIGIVALIILGCQMDLAAQTTAAGANGSWTTGSNWVGGTSPGVSNLGGSNITVSPVWPKYLQVGSYPASTSTVLSFAQNNDTRAITVNGTLVIYGNVDFDNKAMDLVIPNGGVVIILGNLTMNNKIDLDLGGILVVKGTFSKTGAGQGSFTGAGAVYAGTYSGAAADLIPTGNEFNVNPHLNSNPALDYIQYFLETGGQYPLPVELLSFEAFQDGEQISLKWATASEYNFHYFAIERSSNGLDFSEIGRMQGHGTTKIKQNYSFSDRYPQVGRNYYRLKSVDFDGYVEYLSIIMEDYSGKKVFSIYPNPSDGTSLNYQMNFSPDENSSIVVYDNLGKKVETALAIDQNNTLTFLNPLNRGVYYVKIVSNNFSTIERFVVK